MVRGAPGWIRTSNHALRGDSSIQLSYGRSGKPAAQSALAGFLVTAIESTGHVQKRPSFEAWSQRLVQKRTVPYFDF